MLFWYSVPTPPNLYNTTLANGGSVRNHGVEIAINAVPVRTKNFEWKTVVTLAHNASKLLSLSNELYETDSYMNVGGLGEPISVTTHRMEEGRPLGEFWGLKSVGVSENGLFLIENRMEKWLNLPLRWHRMMLTSNIWVMVCQKFI